MRPHQIIIAVLILAAIIALAVITGQKPAVTPASPGTGSVTTASSSSTNAGTATSAAVPATDSDGVLHLPSFTLVDHTNHPITSAELQGKPVLLYFGYTFCPDVCPTELGWVGKVLRVLGDDAKGLQVLFVTIDPGRDTPAVLADYVPLFHPLIRGCTGSDAQIAAIAGPLGVAYRRAQVPTSQPGFYLMDHTSTVFLFDRHGRLAAKLGSTMRTDVTAAVIRGVL